MVRLETVQRDPALVLINTFGFSPLYMCDEKDMVSKGGGGGGGVQGPFTSLFWGRQLLSSTGVYG